MDNQKKTLKKINPPEWAYRFLTWYCSDDLIEEVAGDIHEVFHQRVDELGVKKARRLFIWDVIRFFNYSTIAGRQKRRIKIIDVDMIRNYMKIAWRSLLYQRESSLINVFGLALGLTIIIFLTLYSQHENSFDHFHQNFENIYRLIEETQKPDGEPLFIGSTAPPLGQELVSRYPEAHLSTRIGHFGQSVVTIQDSNKITTPRYYNERDYIISDENFFKIFTLPLISGDENTALSRPAQVVLTRNTAEKYFGNLEVIGKTLTSNRTGELIVSGVMENPPRNSHLKFDFIVSLATFLNTEFGKKYFTSWEQDGISQYFLADASSTKEQWEARLKEVSLDVLGDNKRNRRFHVQPLADIHFGSNHINFELSSIERTKSKKTYLNIFSLIGIIILAIASINYINLATARSLKRSREIGVRKVVGATRRQLIGQFMAESMLTSFIAGLLALIFSLILVDYFNSIAEKDFTYLDILDSQTMLTLLLIVSLVGTVSGVLPSMVLSSIKIVNTIKGIVTNDISSSLIRRGLVVFQFMATLTIIASTLIVYRQLKYIQNKDLGFNDEHLVIVDINSRIARNEFQRFKSEYLKNPSINSVAVSSRVPGEWKTLDQIAVKPGNQTDSTLAYYFAFDEDAIPTLDIELIDGRNFSGNIAADSSAVILNEAAVTSMQMDDPIGSQIMLSGVPYPMKVIGLVKDFNVESLHKSISPTIIGFRQNPVTAMDYFICRVDEKDIAGTLAHLENVQHVLDPETPLEYHFLDKQIERFYHEDVRVSRIFLTAAIITLLIACLGLLGLITFVLGQRLKEVGVRKILGATENQLWLLLSKDIIFLILLALTLAIPLSYLYMQKWLQDFAYAININVLIYLVSGFIVMAIALTTIHFQLQKAIRTNPVNILKE